VEGFIYSRPGAGYFVKYDKEKVKKEKYELFEQESLDYISKAIELGYSFNDILLIMKKYFSRKDSNPSTENPGTKAEDPNQEEVND
jgi:DNA-binding transcriptional regulator YhcF (GntR family)